MGGSGDSISQAGKSSALNVSACSKTLSSRLPFAMMSRGQASCFRIEAHRRTEEPTKQNRIALPFEYLVRGSETNPQGSPTSKRRRGQSPAERTPRRGGCVATNTSAKSPHRPSLCPTSPYATQASICARKLRLMMPFVSARCLQKHR